LASSIVRKKYEVSHSKRKISYLDFKHPSKKKHRQSKRKSLVKRNTLSKMGSSSDNEKFDTLSKMEDLLEKLEFMVVLDQQKAKDK
jgi:hypothetical protein